MNAVAVLPCATLAEAQALARASEMNLPPDPGIILIPPECSILREPIPGCS